MYCCGDGWVLVGLWGGWRQQVSSAGAAAAGTAHGGQVRLAGLCSFNDWLEDGGCVLTFSAGWPVAGGGWGQQMCLEQVPLLLA
jgi:hypothetical protein